MIFEQAAVKHSTEQVAKGNNQRTKPLSGNGGFMLVARFFSKACNWGPLLKSQGAEITNTSPLIISLPRGPQ